MGDRAAALSRCLESLEAQDEIDLDIVVVWNGVAPGASPTRVRDHALPENVGIPEGRNLGLAQTEAPFVLFLDDDAVLLGERVVADALAVMRGQADVGVVALRIVDPDGVTSRRHVPRVGARSAERAGSVAGFLGGACVVRRSAWDEVGGYPGEFYYAMEETDLAWRLADAGWRVWYAASCLVEHPRVEPSRHGGAVRRTARNRVWAARRNLPAVVAVVHLLIWGLVGTVRAARAASWPADLARGYRDGFEALPGPRRPMAWSTVWRLCRVGRPPIV